mmetsp:Transcript_17708/g.44602  ORF Transcript_17708/g.44602 Transcript_17708/m.44602 type:complete len:274 (-) Transcript_17708:243-1064(-)
MHVAASSQVVVLGLVVGMVCHVCTSQVGVWEGIGQRREATAWRVDLLPCCTCTTCCTSCMGCRGRHSQPRHRRIGRRCRGRPHHHLLPCLALGDRAPRPVCLLPCSCRMLGVWCCQWLRRRAGASTCLASWCAATVVCPGSCCSRLVPTRQRDSKLGGMLACTLASSLRARGWWWWRGLLCTPLLKVKARLHRGRRCSRPLPQDTAGGCCWGRCSCSIRLLPLPQHGPRCWGCSIRRRPCSIKVDTACQLLSQALWAVVQQPAQLLRCCCGCR